MVTPFMDGQLHHRAIFDWVHFENFINSWLGFLTINLKTTGQGAEIVLIGHTFNTRDINLVNLITRVNHLVCKVPIIGQNQDT
ncbi:Uncharacterised protein [Streptococcus pneumoniae]|nr:Uncharacterised protein [Streptococcus pneumoniae]